MKTQTGNKIVSYIKTYKRVKPFQLVEKFKISRVAIHKQLVKLQEKKLIQKIGNTPHVYYIVPQKITYRPHYLWDYDYDKLNKTENGRIKILERMINYGPGKNEKIPLKLVRKYWDKLDMYPRRKLLLELLIWGKNLSLQHTRQNFSIK